VTAYTQTCPNSVPDGGPNSASSYPALATGSVSFGSVNPQTVISTGDPLTSVQFDPITSSDACKTIQTLSAQPVPGTAVYSYISGGFTLLGLPRVSATIATVGSYGELNSQLSDVAPDGTERLISRGAYRLTDHQIRTDQLPAARQRLLLRTGPHRPSWSCWAATRRTYVPATTPRSRLPFRTSPWPSPPGWRSSRSRGRAVLRVPAQERDTRKGFRAGGGVRAHDDHVGVHHGPPPAHSSVALREPCSSLAVRTGWPARQRAPAGVRSLLDARRGRWARQRSSR